jgi:hypothetical protein
MIKPTIGGLADLVISHSPPEGHVPYVHISHAPGRTLADYRAVNEAMAESPAPGQLLATAGETDGTLHTIEVWDTKASADRFAAERLFPAFHKTGLGPGADSTYVAFEADRIVLGGADR